MYNRVRVSHLYERIIFLLSVIPLTSLIKNICKQLSIDITEIGSLSNEDKIHFLYDSNIVNIDINKEFEHFKKND